MDAGRDAERVLGEIRALVMGALRSVSQLAVCLTARGEPMRKGAVADIPISMRVAARVAHCGESTIERAVRAKRLKAVPTRRTLDGVEYGVLESDVHRWMQNRAKRGRPPKHRNGDGS